VSHQFLKVKRLGIDTYQEPVVYMRRDCHVCRAEGFSAQSRVKVSVNNKSIIATLNIVDNAILSHSEAGLSEAAWRLISAKEGDKAHFEHPQPVESMSFVRGKLYGTELTADSAQDIINDIFLGRYSDIQLSAYVTACAGNRLNLNETIAITKAMVNIGQKFDWQKDIVLDKHCVGGLPGNRTTPIVTAIVAANGLTMPKTSSRAITSPAGTADTMETLTNVTLNFEQMRDVVNSQGACLAWGGSVSLSPTDDIIIRVERALDLDSEGQLVASVISKKIAAGSTHVLIDIPVGPTAKIRDNQTAKRLAHLLTETGKALGLEVKCVVSDGSQPVGYGIGPALEAQDVIDVLHNKKGAPEDLKERSLSLAASLLELSGVAPARQGLALAKKTLESGKALQKFEQICEAQGGMKSIPQAKFAKPIHSNQTGYVTFINNRFIAKLARLAGAPNSPTAGLVVHKKLGEKVNKGDKIFTLYAEAQGELDYALAFYQSHPEAIRIEDSVL
jgi:thymidine phosphorylase